MTWQPRKVDWNAHVWAMMTSLYQSVGEVDAIELVYVLCGHHIQNDGVSWVTDLHQILVRFNHSSTETIRMIQKAAAMGNWWLAASTRQCACSCMMFCAEIFGETSNHLCIQPPYSPDLVPWNFWLFPKLKSPLKRKRFQTINEICLLYTSDAADDWLVV